MEKVKIAIKKACAKKDEYYKTLEQIENIGKLIKYTNDNKSSLIDIVMEVERTDAPVVIMLLKEIGCSVSYYTGK